MYGVYSSKKGAILVISILVIASAAYTNIDVYAVGPVNIRYFRADPGKSFLDFSIATIERTLLFLLKNGSLMLMKVGESAAKPVVTRTFKSKPVAAEYSSVLDAFLVGFEDGTVKILSPTSLRVIREFEAAGEGEKLWDIEISGNGKYLAVAVKMKYKSAYLDRLAILEMASGRRILQRDINSKDRLVQIFYMKAVEDDILLLEVLDTVCELCERTDTKIESYNLTTLTKIASVMIGNCAKGLDEKSGKIAVARYQVKLPEGFSPLKLIDYRTGRIVSEFYIPGTAHSVALYRDKVHVLYSPARGGGISLEALNTLGKKLFSLEATSAGKLTFLESRFVYATSSRIRIFSSTSVLSEIRVRNIVPVQNPTEIEAVHGLDAVAINYGFKFLYLVEIFDEAKLTLSVGYLGKPVEGAGIKILLQNGTVVEGFTGKDGTFNVVLPLGRIEIEVTSEGFVQEKREVDIVDDMVISFSLKKVPSPRGDLVVHVRDKDSNMPIEMAEVRIFSNSTLYGGGYTDSYGKVLFRNIERGTYRLSVSRDGYRNESFTVVLNGEEVEYTFYIRRRLYRLQVVLLGESSKNLGDLIFLRDEEGRAIRPTSKGPGRIVFDGLNPGMYTIWVNRSGCRITGFPGSILVSQNYTLSLEAACGEQTSKSEVNAIKEEIIRMISGEVHTHIRLNSSFKGETLATFSGDQVLVDSSDKILVIEFFYTRCTGCKYLIPLLKNISENPAYREYVKVYSITVSPADTPYLLEEYKRENNITWDILIDSTNLYLKLNVTAYPTIFVVHDGRIVFMGIGASKELESGPLFSLMNRLQEALDRVSDTRRFMGEMLLLSGIIMLAIYRSVQREESEEGVSTDEEALLDTDSLDVYTIYHSDSDVDF